MSIQRKNIDAVKEEAHRLLQKIDEMERCAGWHNSFNGTRKATLEIRQDDTFNGGQYAGAVKRASMDLSRALVALRR